MHNAHPPKAGQWVQVCDDDCDDQAAGTRSSFWAFPHWCPPHLVLVCVSAALMSSIYDEHKDEDGFLYITYSGENTFGGWELSEGL